MYKKFETIEQYNIQNKAIVAYQDSVTNGEYSKSGTLFEYNPEPEPNPIDGFYYMIVEERYQHLFEGELTELPVEITEPETTEQ